MTNFKSAAILCMALAVAPANVGAIPVKQFNAPAIRMSHSRHSSMSEIENFDNRIVQLDHADADEHLEKTQTPPVNPPHNPNRPPTVFRREESTLGSAFAHTETHHTTSDEPHEGHYNRLSHREDPPPEGPFPKGPHHGGPHHDGPSPDVPPTDLPVTNPKVILTKTLNIEAGTKHSRAIKPHASHDLGAPPGRDALPSLLDTDSEHAHPPPPDPKPVRAPPVMINVRPEDSTPPSEAPAIGARKIEIMKDLKFFRDLHGGISANRQHNRDDSGSGLIKAGGDDEYPPPDPKPARAPPVMINVRPEDTTLPSEAPAFGTRKVEIMKDLKFFRGLHGGISAYRQHNRDDTGSGLRKARDVSDFSLNEFTHEARFSEVLKSVFTSGEANPTRTVATETLQLFPEPSSIDLSHSSSSSFRVNNSDTELLSTAKPGLFEPTSPVSNSTISTPTYTPITTANTPTFDITITPASSYKSGSSISLTKNAAATLSSSTCAFAILLFSLF